MKRLIYLSMAALLVFCTLSCNKNDSQAKPGSIDRPYTTEEAVKVASKLTWVSNTEYETTDVVYVRGKITKVADHGAFKDSGTFGNATFYIASDGTPAYVLKCYRILYFKNQKYTDGPDIQEGDTVIVCGKLLNFQQKTPETEALNAYLFALN
jgi:hypothetical protein